MGGLHLNPLWMGMYIYIYISYKLFLKMKLKMKPLCFHTHVPDATALLWIQNSHQRPMFFFYLYGPVLVFVWRLFTFCFLIWCVSILKLMWRHTCYASAQDKNGIEFSWCRIHFPSFPRSTLFSQLASHIDCHAQDCVESARLSIYKSVQARHGLQPQVPSV